MLREQWNSLRTGDRVLVHHSVDGQLRLAAGVVTAVTAGAGSNDVSVKLSSRGTPEVVHPQRLHVHTDPIEADGHCWRCAADSPVATPPPKRRSA